MANKEVTLLYNEYRLRALESALEGNGSSVETALKNTLDSLYRKFVPHLERAKIESRIQHEEAVARVSPQNTVGVFHLHNTDGDINFSSRYVRGLFKFAKLYSEYMQFDINQYTVDSVVGYFGEHRILDHELFSMVCDTFRSSDKVSVIADIDFESGNVSVLERVQMIGTLIVSATYSQPLELQKRRLICSTMREKHSLRSSSRAKNWKSLQTPCLRTQAHKYKCSSPVRPCFAL